MSPESLGLDGDDVDPSKKGRELKVIELLKAFEPRLEELHDRPGVQASLFYTYGQTYNGLGLYDLAYPFNQRAFDLRTRLLGDEHPDTLAAMSYLARYLALAGDLEEAENLARACLLASERVLGSDHPSVTGRFDTLATVLEKNNKTEEAIEWYRKAARAGVEESQQALKRLGRDW